MKKSNAWVPAVMFVASLGFLIAGLVRDGESGEVGLLVAAGLSFVISVVTYFNLKK